jgi:hypothetical protein
MEELRKQLLMNRTEEVIALERSVLIPSDGAPAKRGHGDDDEETKNSMLLDEFDPSSGEDRPKEAAKDS